LFNDVFFFKLWVKLGGGYLSPLPEEKKMRKTLNALFYSLLSVVFLLLVGFVVVYAQQSQPQSGYRVFIPGVFNDNVQGHTIAGQVVSPGNVPISGVTIRTNQGQAVVTDLQGNYSIEGLGEGVYTLTPTMGETTFSPASSAVVVPPDVIRLDFTAQVECSDVVVNGGFENNSSWEIPITAYRAGYSTSQARSGSRSMRTGITSPGDNTYSYSSAQQKVTIPAGSTDAYLDFWVKPYSGDAKGQSLPRRPEAGAQVDGVQMSGDVQYVLVLDSNFNIIKTLVWQLSDSATWTEYVFNLESYAGRTIWLHYGTYNDGLGGISSMFVDDVSLLVCSGSGAPTPTPGPCTNLLDNPGFESVGDWEIPFTEYPAAYSSAQRHSGSWSMRSGILNPADNTYSYSDFRQSVTIPSGAPVAKARFWLYTLSGEAQNLSISEAITPTGKPFRDTTLSGDLQYVLILDRYQNWIDTLVWQRTDEGYWHYYEFDLRRYAGQTIYLQFGTYNDGWNGITSMFVDDTSVDNCITTPTPGPSPTPTRTPTATPTRTPTPGPCQQLVVNSDFSGNTGWEIPFTDYPAGYSNAEYHSAFRSMRTGIVVLGDNTYSYSDFRQLVNIPSSARNVTLSMWVLPISTGTENLSMPEVIAPTGKSFGETVLSDDLQYLLILDQNQNWIDTLVWQRSNSHIWTNLQFDLHNYAGDKIYLQWGTFNNGTGGITAMYVDDVTLQACP
jgi:hypothetical protein